MKNYYNQYIEQVVESLSSSSNGLKGDSILGLQAEFGKNEIKGAKQKTKWSIFLSQFKDVMILILAGAAVISFVVGERTDAYVILFIIFGNAILGYFQENRAEESIRKLQQMSSQHAWVLRDGKHLEIEASELVPGDVVLLEAGNIIPADGRLMEISAFKTEEAALTGESHSIEKTIEPVSGELLSPGDQMNMVFKGTIVSNGSAKMIVTATGMHTEIGRIASLLEGESQKTPLQIRLAKFSKQLVVIVLFICVVVFLFGWWRGEPLLSLFLTSLSLAVAALPEALPAVITIALATGAARMVKHNALIRRLPAVETLGSVTYICSDKTGTLTKNKMTVEEVWFSDGKEELFMQACLLNNEVKFNDGDELLGDSTEIALVKYASEKGVHREEAFQKLPEIGKLPFDSDRMRMSTVHQYGDKYLLLVKGAPLRIAEVLSADNDTSKEEWLQTNRKWASQGLRVLFLAYKIWDEKPQMLNPEMEKDLEFLGMVGMIDPPREEVIAAIEECKRAGIKTVMITGDQALTAQAIAQRLGMISEDANQVLTGVEMSKLSEVELNEKVQQTAVYARVSPEQKLNIVKALQSHGDFVAMTGDGVNDAPSLKQANIGVAMGITGSDVAKEAAHMILLDDNFATIVKAVKEGRRIYDNIRKFILYVLSCNLGEILIIFFAPLLGMPIPLLPIHILWINLVTDGMPGIALANEPAEKDIMDRPPRPPQESLFGEGLIARIISTGVIMALGALILQYIIASKKYDLDTQHTMIFSFLCFVQLGNALSVRSSRKLLFQINLFRNTLLFITIVVTVGLQLVLVYSSPLESIFKTVALSRNDLMLTFYFSVGTVIVIELSKFIFSKLVSPKAK